MPVLARYLRKEHSNLLIRNDFTDLHFNACSHYMSSREDTSLLREFASLFGHTS